MSDQTRRSVLMLAAGAGYTSLSRLSAFSSDFWNKKDPSEWTAAEINQLTSKSPWAKEVSVSDLEPDAYGVGRGMAGGRRSSLGGIPEQAFKGTVRWESAKPILEALKKPLPEGLTNHYAISVSGMPLYSGTRQRNQSQSDSPQADQITLDRLKGATFLKPKDKPGFPPDVVVQSYGNTYFGFAKEALALQPDDKEVAFTTQFGSVQIKTKFNLKDMLYRGEFSV